MITGTLFPPTESTRGKCAVKPFLRRYRKYLQLRNVDVLRLGRPEIRRILKLIVVRSNINVASIKSLIFFVSYSLK